MGEKMRVLENPKPFDMMTARASEVFTVIMAHRPIGFSFHVIVYRWLNKKEPTRPGKKEGSNGRQNNRLEFINS
jgi:hypothetical protein